MPKNDHCDKSCSTYGDMGHNAKTCWSKPRLESGKQKSKKDDPMGLLRDDRRDYCRSSNDEADEGSFYLIMRADECTDAETLMNLKRNIYGQLLPKKEMT